LENLIPRLNTEFSGFSLKIAMGEQFSTIRNYLDNCRRKRNVSEYDAVGTISKKEAEDLLQIVREFKIEVLRWLEKNHPSTYSRE
jgi:hypothetical protein